MASPITMRRDVAVVCGVIACASAAGYLWYRRRRNGPKHVSQSRSPPRSRQVSSKSKKKSGKKEKENQSRNKDEWSDVEERNEASYTSDSSMHSGSREGKLKRRGRKNQRATVSKASVHGDAESSEINASAVREHQDEEMVIANDPAIVSVGLPVHDMGNSARIDGNQWNGEADKPESGASSEAEIASVEFANLTTKASPVKIVQQTRAISPSVGETIGANDLGKAIAGRNENGISQQVLRHQYAPSPAVSSVKSLCADSPSLGSDFHSEASQDSGKGASTGLASSMSPVEELIEVPPVYEFEVPRDIVGLLIGKKGTTIKWLTEQSQAYIVIRDHFFSDKHKICTLEGTREQINKCLRLIRRKFPPSRFPELRLTPILPPPVASTPRTPVWDNVVQLNLPEGVSCEVAVSSIVNVGHIFVQQPTHPTFPSLSRLDQYMLAVYSQPAGVPPLPRPMEMAVVCAAPVLGGWYRAQTMDYYEDVDEALVKFVDYGGYCRVSASDLRQIRSDFMTLPFQSIECYLSNVSPADESEGWSPDALSMFEQLVLSKVIDARVVGHSSDNIPLVELFAPSQDSKPVFVNQILVDRGFAKRTEA